MEINTRAFGSPSTYIQGPGEFEKLESYTKKFGDIVCFLIDGFLFDRLNSRLNDIYESTDSSYFAIVFQGECSETEVKRIGEIAKDKNAKLMVGIGGGKTMDAAKLTSDLLKIPLGIVPTSASTDAPVSQIAVIYNEAGEHLGSKKLKHSSEFVLVDTEIILDAPKRLFLAGIGDALATWFEAQTNILSGAKNYVGDGYEMCLASKAIAKICYETLLADGRKAVKDLENKKLSKAFENVVEANTLLSGLGFHNTGLSAAHGIHSGLTAIESTHNYLHGEKVAFGLVCQLILEKKEIAEIDEVIKFMVDVELPVTLEQVGVELTESNLLAIAEKTVVGNKLIHNEPFSVSVEDVIKVLKEANELGKKYLKNKY